MSRHPDLNGALSVPTYVYAGRLFGYSGRKPVAST